MGFREDSASNEARERKLDGAETIVDGASRVRITPLTASTAYCPLVLEEFEPGFVRQVEFTGQSRESLVHLTRSLLVGLKLTRHGMDTVSVLCISEEIGCTYVRVLSPCPLDVITGAAVGVELFLPSVNEPVRVNGRIRAQSRVGSDEIVRYVLDVEFCHMSGHAIRELEAFLHDAQSSQHPIMPA
jgi:hypothetical protein